VEEYKCISYYLGHYKPSVWATLSDFALRNSSSGQKSLSLSAFDLERVYHKTNLRNKLEIEVLFPLSGLAT